MEGESPALSVCFLYKMQRWAEMGKLEFTPSMGEKPLQGIKSQGKEEGKEERHIGKLFEKSPKMKCQLTLNLMQFKT